MVFTSTPKLCVMYRIYVQITLMDSNVTVDETYGTVEIDINQIPLDKLIVKTFRFKEVNLISFQFCAPSLKLVFLGRNYTVKRVI